ncbi:hypothetical protein [Nibribacter koreensis]|uniref:Uncharacterized protein n=1 Tax=Nibribacter koreensis TaxID=1084519 RepID=A0ABP8F637_9BACT
MNLLPNSPIRMGYSPSTDILTVEYPDLDPASLHMIRESFTVMVGAI